MRRYRFAQLEEQADDADVADCRVFVSPVLWELRNPAIDQRYRHCRDHRIGREGTATGAHGVDAAMVHNDAFSRRPQMDPTAFAPDIFRNCFYQSLGTAIDITKLFLENRFTRIANALDPGRNPGG